MSGCEALATKAEVAALESRLMELLANKLDKQEKPAIVQASIAGAEQLLDPRIGIALGIAKGAELLGKQGIAKAGEALGKAGQAFGKAVSAFDEAIAANAAALEATARIGLALAQLAELAASVATLLVLGHRIDMVESYVDSVNKTATDAYSISISNSMNLRDLKAYVGKLQAEIEQLKTENYRLSVRLYEAEDTIAKLDRGLKAANAEISKANAEIKRLSAEVTRLNSELAKANSEIQRLSVELNKANADIAYLNGELAKANATIAQLVAQLKAVEAQASKTIAEANAATATANMAWLQSQQTQGDLTNLGWRTETGEIAKSWNKTVWESQVIQPAATQWTRQIESTGNAIAQSFDSKFEQTRQQLQTSIRAQYGDLTDVKLGNFEKQLSENTKAVAALQGTLTNTNAQVQTLTNTQANTQDRLKEQERVNAQAVGQLTRVEQGIRDIPTTVSNAVTGALSPTVTDIQTKVKDLPTAIPTTVAIGTAVVGTMISSVPLKRMLTDSSSTGVCNTTKPGGCLSNQFGNLGNGIKENVGNIINAGNATANAAQLILLKQIDAKLGAQLAGGIGGKLSKFFDWALGDRVMNLVIFTTTLHNAMLLSNSISTTLFGCIDNIARMGQLALNPDGEAIDSSQWISKQLDTFFEGVFGATLWASMKASYAKANNIFSTSSNVYNNLRSIHSDSQELLNMVRRDTAELGNALVEEGVISEDNWDVRNPNIKLKSKSLGRLQRMNEGLEALDDKLQAIETVTATLLSIAESAKEIKDNVTTLNTELSSANTQFKSTRDAAIAALPDFNFDIDDLF